MRQLSSQIWLLAIGRFLSQLGSGLTLFYAPIFFVSKLGLSSTAVGIAIGSQAIFGVAGRLVSGTLVDRIGRKPLLLASMVASAVAAVLFALAQDFWSLVVGNLCFGLGLGLYWPANESLVADLATTSEARRNAYGMTRLADNLGLGIGIVGGGALLQLSFDYRWLFWLDGLSFFLFAWVIVLGIKEPKLVVTKHLSPWRGYWQALQDRRLQVYVLVNLLFTAYVAQLEITLPLYITRFTGGTTGTVTLLFTLNLIVMAAMQIPVIRWLRSDRHAQALGKSAILWGISFVAVALATLHIGHSLGWLVVGMLGTAVAIAAYNPTASALTADIAPAGLMGVYTSINSLCWAVGFAIGAPIGGWALDQSLPLVQGFWLMLTGVAGLMWLMLQWLDRLLLKQPTATIDTQ
jgi:MFS family permease